MSGGLPEKSDRGAINRMLALTPMMLYFQHCQQFKHTYLLMAAWSTLKLQAIVSVKQSVTFNSLSNQKMILEQIAIAIQSIIRGDILLHHSSHRTSSSALAIQKRIQILGRHRCQRDDISQHRQRHEEDWEVERVRARRRILYNNFYINTFFISIISYVELIM